MTDVVLDTRALCQEADAHRLIPGYKPSDGPNDSIIELINAESAYMHGRRSREFVARVTNPATHRFDLGTAEVSERTVEIGDLASVVALVVTIKQIDGTAVQVVAAADYVLLPREREPAYPYTNIWFPWTSASPAPLAAGYVLEVNGTWGFPSIPDDLRQECARNVAAKFLRMSPVSEEAEVDVPRASYRVTDFIG